MLCFLSPIQLYTAELKTAGWEGIELTRGKSGANPSSWLYTAELKTAGQNKVLLDGGNPKNPDTGEKLFIY